MCIPLLCSEAITCIAHILQHTHTHILTCISLAHLRSRIGNAIKNVCTCANRETQRRRLHHVIYMVICAPCVKLSAENTISIGIPGTAIIINANRNAGVRQLVTLLLAGRPSDYRQNKHVHSNTHMRSHARTRETAIPNLIDCFSAHTHTPIKSICGR